MVSKKKILFIVVSIIIICGVGTTCAYFGNYIFKRPAVININPPLRTNIITGWDAYMRGTVTEILDSQITIASNNGMEAVIIKFLSGDKKTIFQKPLSKEDGTLQNIEQKDIQIGDNIFAKVGVSADSEYTAFWILKFLK